MVFRHTSPFEGYRSLLAEVRRTGKWTPSRGGGTYEVEDALICYSGREPVYPPKRSEAAELIGLLEGVQLAGSHSADGLMGQLFPAMLDYTDFSGSYGRRMARAGQLAAVVEQLRESPSTRRAVLTLWDPALDARGTGADHPCTVGFGFRVRDGELNMSVTMRSQDAWRGHYSDVVQFQLLQATVARLLGVATGSYVQHCHSLHLYESDCSAAAEYAASGDEREAPRLVLPLALQGWSCSDTEREATAVLSSAAGACAAEPQTPLGREVAERARARADAVAARQQRALGPAASAADAVGAGDVRDSEP